MGRARKRPYNVVITEELKKKFFSYVKKGPLVTDPLLRCRGHCYDWKGPIATCGRKGTRRGGLWINGGYELASRLSWQIHHGKPLAPGVLAMHFCQREICVRYEHLFPGSESQNGAERVLSGRVARGNRNGQAKLTPKKVRKIDKLAARCVSYKTIGRLMNISRQAAWRAGTRRTWKHIKAL